MLTFKKLFSQKKEPSSLTNDNISEDIINVDMDDLFAKKNLTSTLSLKNLRWPGYKLTFGEQLKSCLALFLANVIAYIPFLSFVKIFKYIGLLSLSTPLPISIVIAIISFIIYVVMFVSASNFLLNFPFFQSDFKIIKQFSEQFLHADHTDFIVHLQKDLSQQLEHKNIKNSNFSVYQYIQSCIDQLDANFKQLKYTIDRGHMNNHYSHDPFIEFIKSYDSIVDNINMIDDIAVINDY